MENLITCSIKFVDDLSSFTIPEFWNLNVQSKVNITNLELVAVCGRCWLALQTL